MQSVKNFFDKNGYFVFENLISNNKIDKICKEFNKFKLSNSIYYSQSEHNWRYTKFDLDEYKNLKCSMENFTELLWAPNLAKAGRNILASKEIDNCLKEISGKDEIFIIGTTNLFDKSTGTIDHIDSYYIDTDPQGFLIAAWVALENIDGNGGEFHIYPGSHLSKDNSWKKMNHDEFIKWSIKLSAKYEKKALNINKGDVVFWHPSLIHGSSSQRMLKYTRKSITAHYHPKNLLRSNGINKKIIDHKIYNDKLEKQIRMSRNYGFPILSRYSRRRIAKSSLVGLLKFFLGKNNSSRLMNRLKTNYDKFN